jgi:hypothetical protein
MKEQQLQEWFMANRVDDKMLWKKASEEQIMFVRDRLPGVLCASREEYNAAKWLVISTHRSKSIELPVYQIRLANGLVITMRDNFYEWKVSFDSPHPIEIDPMGLFDPDKSCHRCYFQGFPEELIYGSYNENKGQFSVEIGHEYRLYTLLHLVARSLPIPSPPKGAEK